MNPLDARGADSQGVVYSLDSSTRTATILNTFYDTGRNIGLFNFMVGKRFMIRSKQHEHLYLDNGGEGHQLCVHNLDGGEEVNRIWTIDTHGRLVPINYPNYCVYIDDIVNQGDARFKLVNISSISNEDEKQFWGFDGKFIFSASNPNGYMELFNATDANNTPIAFRLYDWNDFRRQWRITPLTNTISGSANNSKITFKRGVMDTDGVVYKVTKAYYAAFANTPSINNLQFPKHNIDEIKFYKELMFADYYYYFSSTTIAMRNGTISNEDRSYKYNVLDDYKGRFVKIQFRPKAYQSIAIDYVESGDYLRLWDNTDDIHSKFIVSSYNSIEPYVNIEKRWYVNGNPVTNRYNSVLGIKGTYGGDFTSFRYDGTYISLVYFPGYVLSYKYRGLVNNYSDCLYISPLTGAENQKWVLYVYPS